MPLAGFLKICVPSRTWSGLPATGVRASGYPSLLSLGSCCFFPKEKVLDILKPFPSLIQFRVQLYRRLYRTSWGGAEWSRWEQKEG